MLLGRIYGTKHKLEFVVVFGKDFNFTGHLHEEDKDISDWLFVYFKTVQQLLTVPI